MWCGGGTGTPSPPSFHSSSEPGRSRCHSLRSFSIPRMRSASSPTRIVCFKIFLRFTRYEQRDTNFWRTRLQPIQTFGEITVHIKIFPVQQPYLYQNLSKKATQLRLLGMTYGQIAESLRINRKTAIKAFKYEGR